MNDAALDRGDEIDLRGILGVLRRHWRVILSTVAVVVLLSITYLFSVTPRYTAEALVSIEPNRQAMSDDIAQAMNSTSVSARVDGEIEVMRSDGLLLQLIRSQNLVSDPEFGVQFGRMDRFLSWLGMDVTPQGATPLSSMVEGMRNAIEIRRKGLTYVVSVSVTSEDPAKAQRLANALVDEYIKAQINKKVQLAIAAREVLSTRLEFAKEELEASEGQIDGFVYNYLEDRDDLELGAELASMRAMLQKSNDTLDALREESRLLSLALEGQDWTSLEAEILGDSFRELSRQRAAIVAEIDNSRSRGLSTAEFEAELARLTTELESLAQERLGRAQLDFRTLQTEQEDLRVKVRGAVLSSDLPTDVVAQIFSLQQESTIARDQYQDLLKRIRQLDTLADIQISDATLASPALEPASPSFPRTNLILALSLVLGVGLGFGLAFLNEFFIGGFTSEEQLSGMFGSKHPLSIPSADKVSPEEGGSAVAVAGPSRHIIDAPMSLFSESFRRIKIAAERSIEAHREAGQIEGGAIVLVTSSIPAEGKSTASVSLARTFATSGYKTILIDLDLRKPSVSELILGEERHGSETLLDYLSGKANLEDLTLAFHHETESGLNVILGGGRSQVPTDVLLGSQNMQLLMKRLKENYDVVVVDTAPVLPVVDTHYISRLADVVVLLTRFAFTGQRDVRLAFQRISGEVRPSVDILPVLSMEQSRGGGYYYRGYYSRYGYGYGYGGGRRRATKDEGVSKPSRR
jgi:succinoglycan biosynthesis transport protein ExoP